MAYGLLFLRTIVGLTLFAHGAQKLFGWFGGHGPRGTAGYFGSMGGIRLNSAVVSAS